MLLDCNNFKNKNLTRLHGPASTSVSLSHLTLKYDRGGGEGGEVGGRGGGRGGNKILRSDYYVSRKIVEFVKKTLKNSGI